MPKIAAKRNGAGQAAGGAKKAAAGAKKSKLYNMPEKIKEGTILRDLMKTEWKIGPSIGTGGFGEIYSACKKGEDKYDFVIKCEPHENGPLFVEMHFYMRNARLEDIKKFQKERGIKSLGMPHMIGNGSAEINGIRHRFIVMPRYGSDVAKYFLANGRILPEGTCYRLALQMLDVYEFIHCCGYVHADLKAANILLGYGKQKQQAYLVDFGLASHYTSKDFKPDPKKMHNGTIEYTSRDAHLGVPTMRADLEILGYNLIEWLGIDLPWVKNKLLTAPLKVQKAKENFMSDVEKSLKSIFPEGVPYALTEYFKYITKMEYNEKPNYEKCRKIFTSALKKLRFPIDGDLDFNYKAALSLCNKIKSPSVSRPAKLNTKKQIKTEINISASEEEKESEDEIINASDDDDEDVMFVNHKKPIKQEIKKALKTISKPSTKQANTSLKRNKNDSSFSESLPSPSKRTKLDGIKSPNKKKSPAKQKSPSKANASSNLSASKLRHTPLNAKANVRMSPAVTMSSSRSGKTIINDRTTPNKKPSKTYEFNFELDVSMDANVIVNVKRKKKPLQQSQELQNTSSKNTPSQKLSSTSNSTPVTKVKVRKVASGEDSLDSPRTPAVTVKKLRRVHLTP